MNLGRINSDASIETANRVFRAFKGSWIEVEEAAERREDGVFVIRRPDLRSKRQD
ncbi:MAG: hypothetical protein P8Y58_05445 [Novosphingobium sp.]|uniref:Uncharacterized protein n=1 Tax=Novosphingobium beihaiensis TaxID=2930389 RepID=A0ABT0BQ26_9SPHN|nr:hypothetical protein [Novosphingobium beihaiensis]MCJ2187131.1 hypothetical protein [Novosphingobium beihaiensis]